MVSSEAFNHVLALAGSPVVATAPRTVAPAPPKPRIAFNPHANQLVSLPSHPHQESPILMPSSSMQLSIIIQGRPPSRATTASSTRSVPHIHTPSPRHAPEVFTDMLERAHNREVKKEELSPPQYTVTIDHRRAYNSYAPPSAPGALVRDLAPPPPPSYAAVFNRTVQPKRARSNKSSQPKPKDVLWGLDPIVSSSLHRPEQSAGVEGLGLHLPALDQVYEAQNRRARRNEAYRSLLDTLPRSYKELPDVDSPRFRGTASPRRGPERSYYPLASFSPPPAPQVTSAYLEVSQEDVMYNWASTLSSTYFVLSDEDDSEFAYVLQALGD